MLDRLAAIEKRYQELERQIATPEIATDPKQLQALAQERAGLEDLVAKYRRFKATSSELEEAKSLLAEERDEDMKALAVQEIEILEPQLEEQLQQLKLALLPRDANDDRDIIMEIRAGTGGEEAGLFAADLFACTAAMPRRGKQH